MRRYLAHGLLLSALLLLLPEVAFACSPSVPQPWTKQTVDGEFELSSRVRDKPYGSATLSLKNVRSGKTLWEHTIEEGPRESEALLSPSGSYVALTAMFSPTLTVYGPAGESHQLSLEAHITASEKRKLPYASCGVQWVSKARFEGELLVVEVPTAGMRSPMYEQPKGTAFRFDPKTRQLTRDAPAPQKSTAELIQAYQSTSAPEQRMHWARELAERSQDVTVGGDAALSRFWRELLAASETQPKVLALAVMGLGTMGTEEEVRALARLPAGPPERDLQILQVLKSRAPQEAEAFGLRALEERREPELLRTRAIVFLGDREEAVAERARSLALGDPSEKVREYGLQALARKPMKAKALEQALPFCLAAEAALSRRAADSLRSIVRDAEGTERVQALKVLRAARERGQLKGCPDGYVILAAVADLEKRRSEALALYRQGVKELDALPRERKWHTANLRLEAKLQLAIEAKAKGKEAELKKWAEEVLADEHKQTFVCAPKPNEYAGTGGPDTCTGRRTADAVAEELLKAGRAPSKAR